MSIWYGIWFLEKNAKWLSFRPCVFFSFIIYFTSFNVFWSFMKTMIKWWKSLWVQGQVWVRWRLEEETLLAQYISVMVLGIIFLIFTCMIEKMFHKYLWYSPIMEKKRFRCGKICNIIEQIRGNENDQLNYKIPNTVF